MNCILLCLQVLNEIVKLYLMVLTPRNKLYLMVLTAGNKLYLMVLTPRNISWSSCYIAVLWFYTQKQQVPIIQLFVWLMKSNPYHQYPHEGTVSM